MTTPDQGGRAKLTLRTTDDTADEIRALQGLMTSELGGRRVTQDVLISALAHLGTIKKGELLIILRSRLCPE